MIRPAAASDATRLATIHITSWQNTYGEVFPDEFLDDLDIDRRAEWFDRQIVSGAQILVADADGVVGFCLIGPSNDDGWGEVYAIYVHPEEWGRGHGYRLIIAAESRLREQGFDRMLLWVVDSNRRARTFYERQGWALGKPIRIEEIGGVQVTEVRYEKDLQDSL